ncbi:MAG: cupredoxin domain-containing protein [Phycisphaerae bacterium]
MRSWWGLIGALAILVSTSGQGCGGRAPGPQADDEVATVRMAGQVFSPASVTIQAGQTVRWVNDDFELHTVTSGRPGEPDEGARFDSGVLAPGARFEHVFNEPGTYLYFCDFHAETMRDATVVVE